MADDPVVQLMQRFKRQLLADEAAQMGRMADAWLGLERRLGDGIALLVRTLAERRANGLPVTQGALFRLERYQALLVQIEREWERYAVYAEEEIAAGQRAFGRLGIEQAAGAIERQAVGIAFNRLPVGAVENMVGLLGDGSPLRTLLLASAKRAEAVDGLTRALLEGTALGRNPRKTARLMKDGLARGLNQALTIARTEQLRVYREMNRQSYIESGVVSWMMRLATRDQRTCVACLALDGELIPVDEVMAEHPSGRCAQIAVVDGFAPPQWEKGPAWLARQPEAVQRKVLGAGRFEAWQRGDFALTDLAKTRESATWGRSIHPVPLRELAGG